MASPPGRSLAEGMPPSKQQQHEEALAPLDDQERRAVQKRLMRRSQQGAGQSHTTRSSARDRHHDPAFMSPKTQQRGRSARGAYSSRSAIGTGHSLMTTARSSSPTGRYHPNPTRRVELRQADMLANIDYLAPNGAPDNDRRMKESSWLTGQAFIESLRYYPKGSTAIANNDCEATYSGLTHSARQVPRAPRRLPTPINHDPLPQPRSVRDLRTSSGPSAHTALLTVERAPCRSVAAGRHRAHRNGRAYTVGHRARRRRLARRPVPAGMVPGETAHDDQAHGQGARATPALMPAGA